MTPVRATLVTLLMTVAAVFSLLATLPEPASAPVEVAALAPVGGHGGGVSYESW